MLLRPDASLRSVLQLNCVTNNYNFDRLICSGRTQGDSCNLRKELPYKTVHIVPIVIDPESPRKPSAGAHKFHNQRSSGSGPEAIG